MPRRKIVLRTARTAAAGLALATHALSAQEPAALTTDALLTAPFAEEMMAAPKGGAVAWVRNAQGVRNVWVAEPPSYNGRQLTHYTEDDGQEITSLRWTPDGKSVVYVRGGEANDEGEAPNPTHDPASVEQTLWLAPLGEGREAKIGAGSDPAVSPDGETLAFVREHKLMLATLATPAEHERPVHIRGEASEPTWSPDGRTIAVVDSRGDHGFVALYDVKANTVKFLEPSVDQDISPVWSPDGKRIAFVRLPSSATLVPFKSRRSGPPWSIHVATVVDAKSTTLWRADPGPGSVFQPVNAPKQIWWTADDRIVFPWERDGWMHLYSVPVAGGAAKLLTPGAFEVEEVALAPDTLSLIYNSNQGDTERRHLWRVSAAGGEGPVALTRGASIEWAPAPLSGGGQLAFIQSTARLPARAMIADINGASAAGAPRELVPGSIPASFPSSAFVEPTSVTFRAADGRMAHGQLFVPRTGRGPFPALLYLHGGPTRQMLLGFHYMHYYSNAYAMNQYFASRGFVVLSVNFRGGIGYGLNYREPPGFGPGGASEYNDVLGAATYLRARPDVDKSRIGLWGGSYGGYLTALGLARNSNLFAAGVDLHGVHDWNTYVRKGVDPMLGEATVQALLKQAYASSPMSAVKTWRSPVLIIHGDDDRNVPIHESVILVEMLRKQGVEVEQLVLPDEIHDFLLQSSRRAVYGRTAEYLIRKLRPGTTAALR